MSINFQKRRGLYLSSTDETDQSLQEFHSQISAAASPPADEFPQLHVIRASRSASVDATADGTPHTSSGSGRAVPSKPLPAPPPRAPAARPPSSNQPMKVPEEDPSSLPLPGRTKSPLRPQGIRSNAPLLTIPAPPPTTPSASPKSAPAPPLPSTPAPKLPPSSLPLQRSPSPNPNGTMEALDLSPRVKNRRPEPIQPHKPLLKMSTEPVIMPSAVPPMPTAKQLADPISKSQAEYNHYLNLASREDFTAIKSYNILYNAGKDREGRTVVVFVAHNIPATKIDLESLFLYAISTLDTIVESEYTLLYCHANIPSINQPSYAYLKRVYGIFNRKYKKNLKRLYIIGSGFWLRMTLQVFKAFVSSKFWKKLKRIEDPNDLQKELDVKELRLPEAVFKRRVLREVLPPIFGCSLAEALRRRPTESGLPAPVEKSVEAIRERFMQVEGIFRISGMVKPIESLRKSFDAGEDVDFSIVDDPHAIAGLLKLYLRELPEPLVPFAHYSSFVGIQALKVVDENQWERLNKQLLAELPWENRLLVRYLCAFLKVVSTFQEINRMTTVNLSVCFGPNIMRPEQETMESALRDMPIVGQFVTHLIQRCEDWIAPVARPALPPPSSAAIPLTNSISNLPLITPPPSPTPAAASSPPPPAAASPPQPPLP